MSKPEAGNYLDKIFVHTALEWEADDTGAVTLHVPNTGAMNRVAQVLFKKPKISYIHLDELGSFIWQQIDGEKTVLQIGEAVNDRFGEAAQPLYERLSQYIRTLEMYHFAAEKE